MPKKVSNKRKRYRENKKKAKRAKWFEKQIEEQLNKNNEYGINDPTPFEAVNLIIKKERRKNYEE